jgi:glycine dehydrogenase
MSMQPNSGAQGEYAGLLTIAPITGARRGRGRTHLPDPGLGPWHQPGLGAYGGMEVVVVGVAENGDIDLADFAAKAEAAGDRLAAA